MVKVMNILNNNGFKRRALLGTRNVFHTTRFFSNEDLLMISQYLDTFHYIITPGIFSVYDGVCLYDDDIIPISKKVSTSRIKFSDKKKSNKRGFKNNVY